MIEKSHEHLESVNETYMQHMGFALWFAVKLIVAGVAVIAHAICPAICQSKGSSTVRELYDILQRRQTQHDHGE